MATEETIAALVEPALRPLRMVVEAVSVTPAGRRRVVRVAVDRALDAAGADEAGDVTAPTPPLTLDEVADATRVVSDLLDAGDVLGAAPYVLEVTSPGVDRPLRLPRHYQRNVGRLVRVERPGHPALTGRIVRAGADEVTVAPADGSPERVPYAEVSRAVVQVEFSPPASGDAATDPETETDD